MSYTTVKAIYFGEKTESLIELSNSYGSAPIIWEAMATKYLGITEAYSYPNKGWMQLDDELWNLWKRTDIPIEHRLVFMLTFDRAYVKKENFIRMALSIRKFLKDFPRKSHVDNEDGRQIIRETAHHWDRIAKLLESNPDVPGIGLHCTSVSDDPFLGPWNEEKEDYDQPDWSQIYDVCEVIDGLNG